jgi:hypothetical protein
MLVCSTGKDSTFTAAVNCATLSKRMLPAASICNKCLYTATAGCTAAMALPAAEPSSTTAVDVDADAVPSLLVAAEASFGVAAMRAAEISCSISM